MIIINYFQMISLLLHFYFIGPSPITDHQGGAALSGRTMPQPLVLIPERDNDLFRRPRIAMMLAMAMEAASLHQKAMPMAVS